MKEHVVGDANISSQVDLFPKANKLIGLFVPPPSKNKEIGDNDLPLKWPVQKQRGNKGKEKVDESVKVTKTLTQQKVFKEN